MKLLIFIFVLAFPSFAFAAVESNGFFDGVFQFFYDIIYIFTDVIPAAVQQFFVYISTYVIYIKFLLLKSSLEFAHSVAIGFLDLVNINNVVNSAISSLPSDLRQVASDIRFFDGFTLIIEAAITRFVYQSTT